MGKGCGGIVADGKQAREQRRGAVVRGVTLQPTKVTVAVWYWCNTCGRSRTRQKEVKKGTRSM